MATDVQRRQMAAAIVNFEARRVDGHIAVYKLPKNDGGGRFEVAGINERFNKATCDRLVELIGEGKYDEAEIIGDRFHRSGHGSGRAVGQRAGHRILFA